MVPSISIIRYGVGEMVGDELDILEIIDIFSLYLGCKTKKILGVETNSLGGPN